MNSKKIECKFVAISKNHINKVIMIIICLSKRWKMCLYTLLYYYLGLLGTSGIYGKASAWLGLRHVDTEGTLMWTDGTPGIIFL